MAFYANKRWSTKEDEILSKLAQEGCTAGRIKYVIKDICNSYRSESAIASRAKSKLFITLEYSKGKTLDDFPEEKEVPPYSGMPLQDDVTALLEPKREALPTTSIRAIKDYLVRGGCTKFSELTELREYLEEYGYIDPIPRYGVNFRWDEEQDNHLLGLIERYPNIGANLRTIVAEYNDTFGINRKFDVISERIIKLKSKGEAIAAPRSEISAPAAAKWTKQQVQLVLDSRDKGLEAIAKELQDTFGVTRTEKSLVSLISALEQASPALTEEELAAYRKRFSGISTVKRKSPFIKDPL
jgi:hypothetical protein